MTPHEILYALVVALLGLSALGVLAGLGIWALYALEGFLQRRAQRREMERLAIVLRDRYEAHVPDDPDERAQYEAELADLAENGPAE